METTNILIGDVRSQLQTIPENSVQCVVTSPPYWGLRDYGTATWTGGDSRCNHKIGRFEYSVSGKQASNSASAGHQAYDVCPKCGAQRVDSQIGLEQTPTEYVEQMVVVFRDVRRVLKNDGVLWLNLGDSYAGNNSRASNNGRAGFGNEREGVFTKTGEGLKPKDLVGIPWRVAFALQQDGWYIRQDIIWAKPNPMPESVVDRCTKSHEYLFMLTKEPRYYFNSEAIKEPSTTKGYETRNKRDVWTIPVRPFKEAHFAVMPEALVEPCILASTQQNDTVLDPFTGSGTTGVVAYKLRRNFIGVELNPEYATLANNRIRNTKQPLWTAI